MEISKRIDLLIMKLFYMLVLILSLLNLTSSCPVSKYYFANSCYSACTISSYLLQSNTTNGPINTNITNTNTSSGNTTIPQIITNLYYKSIGALYCVSQCDFQCLTCKDYADFCLTCNNLLNVNYLIINYGKCFANCPSLYYTNYSSLTCELCHSLTPLNCNNCTNNPSCTINGGSINCNASDEIVCLECQFPYYKFIAQSNSNFLKCISSIPDGYVNINNQAVICSSQCLKCEGFAQNCTSCKTINYINSQCVPTCPNSHYSTIKTVIFNLTGISTLTCTRCAQPCNTCLNQTFCLSCIINTYLIQTSSLCVTSSNCPSYTYANTTSYRCVTCIFPCVRCLNQIECKQCALNNLLLNKECVQSCPNNTYPNTINDVLSANQLTHICSACIGSCSTCINATACTSCLVSTGLFYFQKSNTCVSNCPKGYYNDQYLLICVKCSIGCQICNNTQCQKCHSVNGVEYYMSGRFCVLQCPIQSYIQSQIYKVDNSTYNACKPCNVSCKICLNQTYCSECSIKYYFFELNFSCLLQCPTNAPVHSLITSLNNYQCLACSDIYCIQCTKSDYCTSCSNMTSQKQTIVLYNGSCLTSCPQPYVLYINITSKQKTCQSIQQIILSIVVIKGIILNLYVPYICVMISAGVTFVVGCLFLIIYLCTKVKRQLFAFLSAIVAIVQTFSIALVAIYHFYYHIYDFQDRLDFDAWTIVFFASIFFSILLNFTYLGIFCKISSKDKSINQWKNHASLLSRCIFYFVQMLSLINFKISNILWSKFSFFPILQTPVKLKPFTIISGINLIPTIGIILSTLLFSTKQSQVNKIYYDSIAIELFSSLCLLISLKRPQNLFIFDLSEKVSDLSKTHFHLHKRIYDDDYFWNAGIKPTHTYQEVKNHKDMQKTQIRSVNQLLSQRKSTQTQIGIRRFDPSITEVYTVDQNWSQGKQKIILPHKTYNNASIQCSILQLSQDDDRSSNVMAIDSRQTLKDEKYESIFNTNALHTSLPLNFGQSRSEIQTQQQISDNLNEAISNIQQGSDKVELGSFNQDQQVLNQYQNQQQQSQIQQIIIRNQFLKFNKSKNQIQINNLSQKNDVSKQLQKQQSDQDINSNQGVFQESIGLQYQSSKQYSIIFKQNKIQLQKPNQIYKKQNSYNEQCQDEQQLNQDNQKIQLKTNSKQQQFIKNSSILNNSSYSSEFQSNQLSNYYQMQNQKTNRYQLQNQQLLKCQKDVQIIPNIFENFNQQSLDQSVNRLQNYSQVKSVQKYFNQSKINQSLNKNQTSFIQQLKNQPSFKNNSFLSKKSKKSVIRNQAEVIEVNQDQIQNIQFNEDIQSNEIIQQSKFIKQQNDYYQQFDQSFNSHKKTQILQKNHTNEQMNPSQQDQIQQKKQPPQNNFRIQTKIKNPNGQSRQNYLKKVSSKQQLIIMNNHQFKNLKRNLKSIQKQQQKQQKILRRIQSGTLYMTQKVNHQSHNKYSSNLSKNKSRQKSQIQANSIEKQRKRSHKRKLELQSKAHVEKIYGNTNSSLHRNTSKQKSKQKPSKSIDRSKQKNIDRSKQKNIDRSKQKKIDQSKQKNINRSKQKNKK